MLLHQHFLSVLSQPLVSRPLSLLSNPTIQNSRFGCGNGGGEQLKKREFDFFSHRAVERESEFEVDPDKAREALRKLDEQLQSLTQKQIRPPKIRASDLDRAPFQMREETPEFSVSFLAYSAFAFLLFTIFYNVLFITVIKPSIDGQEPVAATSLRQASGAVLLPEFPSLLKD